MGGRGDVIIADKVAFARASRLARGALLLGGLIAAACIETDMAAPGNPDPIPVPRLVNVNIEYRQPSTCFNSSAGCNGSVFFYGSWMRPGNEFAMRPQPGGFLWTGTASGVPVNYPPQDQPYFVRIFDPYLLDTPSAGITAERLKVGGQLIVWFETPGTPTEAGLVYIDDNGQGRSPF
jgi:hypothetical protein